MHQDQTKSCGKHIFPQLGLAAAEKQNSTTAQNIVFLQIKQTHPFFRK